MNTIQPYISGWITAVQVFITKFLKQQQQKQKNACGMILFIQTSKWIQLVLVGETIYYRK